MDDNRPGDDGSVHPQVRPAFGGVLFGVPLLTLAILVACGSIWALLNFGPQAAEDSALDRALSPSALRIWSGAYWGLLTSAFVHFELLHCLFNMWWTRDFGRLLEPRFGLVKYAAFIVASAVVSSGAQLAFSDQTGIGFSGVVYAFFGYMLAAREREEAFSRFLTRDTIMWLLGWLVLCMILSWQGTWNVGNAAHLGGLVFGFLLGIPAGRGVTLVTAARVGAAALLLGAISTAFYAPWSAEWRIRHILQQFAQEDSFAVNDQRSLDLLRKAAEQGHIPSMNLLAWRLATNESEPDGKTALEWATKACEEADGWKEPAYIDTLAAAYAALANWNQALAYQKMAIAKLDPEDSELRQDLVSRLSKYQEASSHGTKE